MKKCKYRGFVAVTRVSEAEEEIKHQARSTKHQAPANPQPPTKHQVIAVSRAARADGQEASAIYFLLRSDSNHHDRPPKQPISRQRYFPPPKQ